MIESNLLLPLDLLELAVKWGTQTFVNTDTLLDKRVNDYSLSKRQFKEWLPSFAGSVEVVNVALEHFFGPGDDPTKFVTMMVRQALVHKGPILLTPGEQIRDFIYIDDVVSAFMRILEVHCSAVPTRERSGNVVSYEVGSGNGTSIRAFMELLMTLSNSRDVELRFGALPYRDREVMHSIVSGSAIRSLGWRPQTSLHDGLIKTIAAERALTKGLQ